MIKKTYQYYIGIDCGVQTGYAVWCKKDKRILCCDSFMIHQVLLFLKVADKSSTFVRVEDARLRTWIPKKKDEKGERGRAQGAGSIKRDAKIWEDFLTEEGFDFEMVPPKQNKTKVHAAYFKKITGWTAQTNEHARDAAMLVVGI